MAVASPRQQGRFYDKAPLEWGGDTEAWVKLMARVVNNLVDGKLNVIGSVTLSDGADTTTLTDSRIGQFSYVGLMPATANAAGALATTYVVCGDKSATIHHANNAQTDRTFRYVILGG